MKPAGLASLAAEPVSAAAVKFEMRSHGAGLRPFAALLARFGKAAARDVQLVDRVLRTASNTVLTESASGEAWAAVRRLAERAETIADGPERLRTAVELERAMLALLSRESGFAEAFSDGVAAAAREARDLKDAAAVKAAGKHLLHTPAPTTASKVLGRMATLVDAGDPLLARLWRRYRAVAGAPAGLERAAAVAAQQADAMAAVLRRKGLSTVERRLKLWGYLSKIRGELGEAYALGNRVWLGEVEKELARAWAIAAQLGPGHTVEYLTQAAHGLRVNGREGADAMIVIVDHANKVVYDTMRGQVKIATFSEGAGQSANDVFRAIGLERGAAPGVASLEFRSSTTGLTEAYTLASRPEVSTRLYLLNAAGSVTPAQDLADLAALGYPVTEIVLDMTVSQFTHLAISVAESAVKLVTVGP
ncbi:hypothetical protein FE374_14315 [Georgenia yuyongxinii]|uniref:Uncharacterized protein n=1 Tax=Georgenia yuyongxinii TaxID=2589797 RepID=A0A5B8C4W3_9MICO|nr:hypothetical protein [Georgenia yuyongxinii]QDC25623.1 hypothetical protein FE374_14315 [Georgenia yuyongxinii]